MIDQSSASALTAPTPSEITDPVTLDDYDVVLVNSSAGKDSQAMLDALVRLADAQGCPRSKFVVVHADLGRVEWEGVRDLAAEQSAHYGLRFEVVSRPQGDLLNQIKDRGMFPSSTARYCTSDQKTGQVKRLITRLVAEQVDAGHDLAARPVRILNCLGMRAQESPARAKKTPFGRDTASNGKRHVDRWLPTFDWTARKDPTGTEPDDIWTTIHASGVRYHPAYTAGMTRLSCCFCLAGDTEVVTRHGIAPIASLAGGAHDLLIPERRMGTLTTHATFVPTEVRSFGVQHLMKITLRRRRQTKIVHATPEHRWLTHGRGKQKIDAEGRRRGYDIVTTIETTEELAPGTRLLSIRARRSAKASRVPFAVAQGFVFGDGTKGTGERPATLTIYDKGKDSALLPYFAAHDIRETTVSGKDVLRIYGLPRTWKSLPDIEESRPFLLSWLAGYFAADGTVTTDGSARLASATREHLEFVRSVAAICGVGYGPIRKSTRSGFPGREPSNIYYLNLDAKALPDWFFVIPEHRRRAEAKGAGAVEPGHNTWTVESIESTDRKEEVYCAVVPDVHAFGLSDGLMTGNCVLARERDLILAARLNPSLAAEYLAVEQRIGHTFKKDLSMAQIVERAAVDSMA